MWSQYKQDHILYTEHYQFQTQRHRRYIDVGTNDPVFISNTFMFDQCLGWEGICVEPQRAYHRGLLERRTCEIVPTCVSDTPGTTVAFRSAGGLGGIATSFKSSSSAARGANATGSSEQRKRANAPVEQLQCVAVSTVLKRRGWRHVDVMSVDVEGHEYQALRSVDWNYTSVDVLIIETVTPPTLRLLNALGYWHRASREPEPGRAGHGPNELWIHRRVRWGEPGDWHA